MYPVKSIVRTCAIPRLELLADGASRSRPFIIVSSVAREVAAPVAPRAPVSRHPATAAERRMACALLSRSVDLIASSILSQCVRMGAKLENEDGRVVATLCIDVNLSGYLENAALRLPPMGFRLADQTLT